jgi:hypothetical protein
MKNVLKSAINFVRGDEPMLPGKQVCVRPLTTSKSDVFAIVFNPPPLAPMGDLVRDAAVDVHRCLFYFHSYNIAMSTYDDVKLGHKLRYIAASISRTQAGGSEKTNQTLLDKEDKCFVARAIATSISLAVLGGIASLLYNAKSTDMKKQISDFNGKFVTVSSDVAMVYLKHRLNIINQHINKFEHTDMQPYTEKELQQMLPKPRWQSGGSTEKMRILLSIKRNIQENLITLIMEKGMNIIFSLYPLFFFKAVYNTVLLYLAIQYPTLCKPRAKAINPKEKKIYDEITKHLDPNRTQS